MRHWGIWVACLIQSIIHRRTSGRKGGLRDVGGAKERGVRGGLENVVIIA